MSMTAKQRVMAYFKAHQEATIQARWVPIEIGLYERRSIQAVEHVALTEAADDLAVDGFLQRIGRGEPTDVLMMGHDR